MTNQTFATYAQEIQPHVRSVLKKKEILKDWKATDKECLAFVDEIKEVQERYKKYVEDTETELLGEIKALETDIKLAIKASVKGTDYKASMVKAFFVARAKESVDKVLDKAEAFNDLTNELL